MILMTALLFFLRPEHDKIATKPRLCHDDFAPYNIKSHQYLRRVGAAQKPHENLRLLPPWIELFHLCVCHFCCKPFHLAHFAANSCRALLSNVVSNKPFWTKQFGKKEESEIYDIRAAGALQGGQLGCHPGCLPNAPL